MRVETGARVSLQRVIFVVCEHRLNLLLPCLYSFFLLTDLSFYLKIKRKKNVYLKCGKYNLEEIFTLSKLNMI